MIIFIGYLFIYYIIVLNVYITWQSGLSHFTSHTDVFGSKQDVWHFGGSQTGSQIAGHFGSSHLHAHSGWHFEFSDINLQNIDTYHKHKTNIKHFIYIFYIILSKYYIYILNHITLFNVLSDCYYFSSWKNLNFNNI